MTESAETEVMVSSPTPSSRGSTSCGRRDPSRVYLRGLLREPPTDHDVADHRRPWRSCRTRSRAARSPPRLRSSGRSETRTTGTSTMTSLGYSPIELLEGLEDAQCGLRDLEEAVERMKDPPDDLVEAVDRIRRALADF